jgi:hypothetical protein
MSWTIKIWLWWAINILKWQYIDVKKGGDDGIEAITFSANEEYIDKISKIE